MAYQLDSDSSDLELDYSDPESDDEPLPACFLKPGEDFLRNTFHFPSFRDLPHENDVEYGYWKESRLGVYQPGCRWFFMAEITNNETSHIHFLRHRVAVRDRAGRNNINISFYAKKGRFDYRTLKKGSTILVTNGQQHNFLDFSVGLRIENLDSTRVAPCSMRELLQLSKQYHERKDAKCWSCGCSAADLATTVAATGATVAATGATVAATVAATGATVATTGATVAATSATVAATGATVAAGGATELKKCAVCRMAHYCSKACQMKDWREGGHKRMCKAVPIFRKLTKVDYTRSYASSPFWSYNFGGLPDFRELLLAGIFSDW